VGRGQRRRVREDRGTRGQVVTHPRGRGRHAQASRNSVSSSPNADGWRSRSPAGQEKDGLAVPHGARKDEANGVLSSGSVPSNRS
jgi:hypothetical protein